MKSLEGVFSTPSPQVALSPSSRLVMAPDRRRPPPRRGLKHPRRPMLTVPGDALALQPQRRSPQRQPILSTLAILEETADEVFKVYMTRKTQGWFRRWGCPRPSDAAASPGPGAAHRGAGGCAGVVIADG
jgi:hypothetical protein